MSTQRVRYATSQSWMLHPVRHHHKTGYQTVYVQAEDLGGEFIRINRGLPAGNVANFSPCILHREGHRLIAWRSQPEHFVFRHDQKYFYYNNVPTDVYVGELISYDTIAGAHKLRGDKPHRLSYEDPRLFLGPDKNVYCQFVTSSYATNWDQSKHLLVNQPRICVGVLDEFGEAMDCIYPPLGNNLVPDTPEKNWCFFSEGEELKLLYSTVPLVIKYNDKPDKVIDSTPIEKLTGGFPTFNSTAPIKIGDEWMVFFHWKYMAYDTAHQQQYLLYHCGVYTLDEDMTRITRICTEAIFSGSVRDELTWWTDCMGNPISKQPACILPFGGEYVEEDDAIELALGVNDSFMGIFRCSLPNLLGILRTVK